jgi:hypothetical protein
MEYLIVGGGYALGLLFLAFVSSCHARAKRNRAIRIPTQRRDN